MPQRGSGRNYRPLTAWTGLHDYLLRGRPADPSHAGRPRFLSRLLSASPRAPVSAFFEALLAAFLPLFVAINIPGILPLYIGMTETMDRHSRQSLLVKALTAAFVLAVLMLFAGDLIFRTLGISVHDLRVGGGLILLIIAITDLAFNDIKKRRGGKDLKRSQQALSEFEGDVGEPEASVVPLGIPLIIGPGAITTILIAKGQFGYPPTLGSIVLNMLLVFVAFTFGPTLLRYAGPSTSKAIAKVASLFLAAIAVAMIRGGILGMLAGS